MSSILRRGPALAWQTLQEDRKAEQHQTQARAGAYVQMKEMEQAQIRQSRLKNADPNKREDQDFVVNAIRTNSNDMQYVSDAFKASHVFMREIVQRNGRLLKYANTTVRNDRNVVETAVTNDGLAFEYAGADLKADGRLAIVALKNGRWDASNFFQQIATTLKTDKAFIVKVLQIHPEWLSKVDPSLRTHADVVIAAAGKDSRCFELAEPACWEDKSFVLLALQSDGRYLRKASDSLKADRDAVLAAVRNYGPALWYASKDMQEDGEVVFAAIRQSAWHRQEALNMSRIGSVLKADKAFGLALVKYKGVYLQHLDETLRSDKDVVRVAIQTSPSSLRYASQALQEDRELKQLAGVCCGGRCCSCCMCVIC